MRRNNYRRTYRRYRPRYQRRIIRFNYNTKSSKTYSFTVKSPVIEYKNPTYTQQNLKFDIYDMLYNNIIFQQLRSEFSQYKLDKLTFFAIPKIVDGHDPYPIWIYLDRNGDETEFNYSRMPELQGSKLLPTKRFSMTTYTSSGKQTDFHYWHDASPYVTTPGLSIRLHASEGPGIAAFWNFQLGYVLKFRGYRATESNSTKEDNVDIINLKLDNLELSSRDLRLQTGEEAGDQNDS